MQSILKFQPIYKEKLWGGRKLEFLLNRKIPLGNIGESWEVSDYGDDISIIDNGDLKGQTFREAYKKYPKEILGEKFESGDQFSLLVKIIDAREKLSIQVHPDDEYTSKYDPENSGKKEAWLVLQSDPKSSIVCGFSETTNRSHYKKLIQENKAETILQNIHALKDDAFLINPGTIHGIGGGTLILEIQQSSDSTYRVYDFGRLEKNGTPRKLHLDKALDVLNFTKSNGQEFLKPIIISNKRKLLTATDKFRLEIFETESNDILPKIHELNLFQIFHVIKGSFTSEDSFFSIGDTFFATSAGMKRSIPISPKEKVKLAVMSMGE